MNTLQNSVRFGFVVAMVLCLFVLAAPKAFADESGEGCIYCPGLGSEPGPITYTYPPAATPGLGSEPGPITYTYPPSSTPGNPGTVTVESVPVYTNYDVYAQTPYYASTPYYDYGGYPYYGSTGYGYASLGIGFGTSFFPTSTFFPTTTFVPTPVTSFVPTSIPSAPSNTYAPTTVNAPTTTYAPTSVYSPTSTYAPTNTSTYAPTNVSTYAPTNTSTYAPTTYTSSVYSPTSNPTSVYAPSDSHNVVGPTTVTTDSHNNTTVSVVSNTSQAAPQYPVQYVYTGGYSGGGSYLNTPTYYNTPTYFPYVQAPSCVLTASNSGYNFNYGAGATVLTWSSTNANSGYITPLVGTVAPSGSTAVYPRGNTLYTLTVSGNGGTSSCQTYTSGSYVAPIAAVYSAPAVAAAAAAPYVALTQIPYTGFDFGTFGNAMYWALLALFAVAISYLVLYFRGGAFALVSGLVRGTAKASVPAQRETTVSAPAVQESKPVSVAGNFGGTKDSMLSVGETEGGIGPRIVVLRS